MIDGFRYGFFGVSDVAPENEPGGRRIAFAIVSVLSTLALLRSGYKLRY